MNCKFVLMVFLWVLMPFLIFGNDRYITTTSLHVRNGEGKGYPVIITISEGDELEVISRNGYWSKIEYRDRIGYVNSKFIKPVSKNILDYSFEFIFFIVFGLSIMVVVALYNYGKFEKRRIARRDYYRNVYLQSEEWKKKRYVVLKRDNFCCVYCKGRATQVHHTRYSTWKIGSEPIHWLESVCKSCHDAKHI